jgi:hypothetical protein
MTPLKSMANASTPDAQTIAIQPFDKTCAATVACSRCAQLYAWRTATHVHTPTWRRRLSRALFPRTQRTR